MDAHACHGGRGDRVVRSTGDWFSDHEEDGSWGESADDEQVEKPEPWDALQR
jgi:hypothetical protein